MTGFGPSETRVTDDANLIEDLGADNSDIIEVLMSYEERFDTDIRDDAATDFATVGGMVRLIERQVAAAEAWTKSLPAPLGIRLRVTNLKSCLSRTGDVPQRPPA